MKKKHLKSGNSKREEALSMKEALGGIDVKARPEKITKKFSIREVLWNYPDFLHKIFFKLVPLSYIVVFGLLGLGVSLTLQSNAMADLFNNSGSKSTIIEGCVGSSSTLNPLFVSVNEIDKSIQNLVFEKLVDLDVQGIPQPNVAESWSVSDDGLEYDFIIANNLLWQDGEQLTVDDVVFTFQTAISLYEDYNYDSVGSSLSGVAIEKIDETRIRFYLEDESPAFFEAVSIYILPKHRLENVSLEDMPFDVFAKYPLGSGRYRVVRNDENYISLKDSEVDITEPQIKNIIFRMYSDVSSLEAAFRNGTLDSFGVLDVGNASFVEEYESFTQFSLPLELRNKLVFLNNRNGLFESKNMRIGLSYLLNIEKLLEKSEIRGVEVAGPIQESSWAFYKDLEGYSYNPKEAAKLFGAVGYKFNEDSGYFESEDNEILSFTISYLNNDINNRLIDAFEELLLEEGIILKKEPLSYSQISQEIIATRNFEMLLYEVEVMIDPDQYNLWHSLKKNYPDLNIAGYEYERVDILLEEARASSDKKIRKQKYELFQKYVVNDAPVLFLYHPEYTYLVKSKVSGVDLSNISYPSQRFDNIHNWSWE